MPRELVLANPNLFVTLDGHGWMRDLYYPQVGELNHILGYPCRMGVTVDRRFTWLDENCRAQAGWQSPASSIAKLRWEVEPEKVSGEMLAAVDPERPLLVRQFTFTNHGGQPVTIGLLLHHDLRIAESDIGDTVFFHPSLRAMLHHKRDYCFGAGTFRLSPPIVQYACGVKGFGGAEGTWRDAEDGQLAMNAIAQGSVDSTVLLQAEAEPGGQTRFEVWFACARSLDEMEETGRAVQLEDASQTIRRSEESFQAFKGGPQTAVAGYAEEFARSLYVTRAHCSGTGAILAANDTDILQTARAHYSYVWPRDGAIISAALARAGHPETGWRFLEFCRPLILPKRPYFLQKYGPTGTVGASWHPWVDQGREIVPFQEDGTALVLWLAGLLAEGDPERLSGAEGRELFQSFIRPMADFLASYTDPETGLPLPSFDPWEERRGIHAWTCGAVTAGLKAAAKIAETADAGNEAAHYTRAAEGVLEGVRKHMWDTETGRFARTARIDEQRHIQRDTTPDSSIAGLFLFGAMEPDDSGLSATMDAVFQALSVHTPLGGVARNRGDYYFRVTDDLDRVPGNPWVICTLWAARWAALKGQAAQARRMVDTALRMASPTGMLPEQVNPITGEPFAVQPLAWAHAELMLALLDAGLVRMDR